MKQLAIKQIDYLFIPSAAEKRIEDKIWDWYCAFDSYNVPVIHNDMLFMDTPARAALLEPFKEIGEYLYAKDEEGLVFNSEQFPVDKSLWTDQQFNAAEEAYMDMKIRGVMEFAFYGDMRRYLNSHYIFYSEGYSYDQFNETIKPTHQNAPLCEVW